MANPADEFWFFCIILIVFIIISVAGVIHFSMKIVRKSYRSGGVLASKDDLIVYRQNTYIKPHRTQRIGQYSNRPPSQEPSSRKNERK